MADGSQQSLLPQPTDDAATTFKRKGTCWVKVLKIGTGLVIFAIVASSLLYYGAPFWRPRSGYLFDSAMTRNCSHVTTGPNQKRCCCPRNSTGRPARIRPTSPASVSQKCDPDKEEQRLPQSILIGARKGGTRALIRFLRLNSAIVPSPDEVHFFDNEEFYAEGVQSYRECMPFTRCGQVTLEKTPAYFTESLVPERVHQMNSSIKLILVLREPTERAVSDWLQLKEKKLRRGKPVQSFEEIAIKERTGLVRQHNSVIHRSIYHIYLARWLRYFPRRQFLILCSEDLVEDPATELQKVERFLGVKSEITSDDFYFNETKGFYCVRKTYGSGCLAESKGRPHPHVDKNVMKQLRDFYRPHNKILFRLIGKECDWS